MARILIIDDDLAVLESLQIVLEENGHSVETSDNGRGGMKMIQSTPFDLIITDIVMPEKDGMEILLDIKKDHPSLKVITISGGARISAEDYLICAGGLGADGILAKPFSATELRQCVERVLG